MRFPRKSASIGVVVAGMLAVTAVAMADINGGPGNNCLEGNAQPNTMNGFGGNDQLYGFQANDVIDGGDDIDGASGGGGNDVLIGGAGWDDGDITQGDCTPTGGISPDRTLGLHGNSGADWVIGADGNDRITGGDGEDALQGDGGDDLIFAEDGNPDTVNGGPGSDVCHINPSDTVTNCEVIR